MKKVKKEKVKMPRWILFIFTTASKLFLFFVHRPKVDRKVLKQQKRGCILIYNHFSNKDHYFIQKAVGYRPINYVLASYFFFKQPLGTFLNFANAISKDQFKPDIMAIRKMKKVVDQDGIICIAPAGQTSIDGASPFISPQIVKLIRMAKTDVLALRMEGTYLTYPKWRLSKRKTKINLKFVKVLNKEDIPNYTDEEIYNLVRESINVNEYKDQLTRKRIIKGKSLASGLETVLVRCPKCHDTHSYKTDGTILTCTTCNNQLKVNQYGLFEKVKDDDVIFNNLPDWYKWQKEELSKLLDTFEIKQNVKLQSNIKTINSLEECGEGVLYLNKDRLYYEGTLYNEPILKEFKLDQIPQIPFEPSVRLEIPDDEAMFRFIPENIYTIIDYVQFVDLLNDERNKQNEKNSN